LVEIADLTVFRGLADDTWAGLMLGATALPALPPEQLQRDWCGTAGASLAQQSADFYTLLKESHARHSIKPLHASRILDFGCGWGRLTRLFAKDVPAEMIFGCDPDASILEWCRHIPGTFRQSDTIPQRLPFDERFDLIFAFSVFTHLGPATHAKALRSLHAALSQDGLILATIRPRAFIEVRGGELARLSEAAVRDLLAEYDSGRFVYDPHNRPLAEGEVPYGEAVIPLAYMTRHWTEMFDIVEVSPASPSDPYQIPVVMRPR
jgi:SAM-dependent methyltransferase